MKKCLRLAIGPSGIQPCQDIGYQDDIEWDLISLVIS